MNPRFTRRRAQFALSLLGLAALAGCGGHSDPLPTYLIGGTATGLFGTVVLDNNGNDRLNVSSNGAFTFSKAVRRGDSYTATVISTPEGQACSLSNAAGVASDHVTNMLLTCTGTGPTFSIGGTVTGLTGQLVLRNNTEVLVVSQNGPFTFSTPLRTGLTYAVSVATQPPGQTCTVANGAGVVGTTNITSVAVTCTSASPATFTLGGSVSGLTGRVVLRNGTQSLEVTANGTFTFPTALPNGSSYAVSVQTNPAGQTCAVANGSGTIDGANVTNVAVSCSTLAPATFTLGGTVSGLDGQVVLRNGTQSLTITQSGPFTFPVALQAGTSYSVTVQNQPAGQTCTITNGSGTIGAGNVTNVAVACVTPAPSTFTLGGTVSGLEGQLVLRNGNQSLTITQSGPFTFPIALQAGTSYSVSVQTQPAGQTCTVTNGSGTIGSADVTNIGVACTTNEPAAYSIRGVVRGLSTGVLRLGLAHPGSAGVTIELTSNGSFSFDPEKVRTGDSYSVTVVQQPDGLTCVVENGTGTVADRDVNDVDVRCEAGTQFAVGGTIVGLSGTGLRVQHGTANAVEPQPAASEFTLPDEFADGAEYDLAITSQPVGQTCVITDSHGRVAGSKVDRVRVSCVDNLTDPLVGTYVLSSSGGGGDAVGYLTLFADGVYVYGSVENDPNCGSANGNGVEYGIYSYVANTAQFRLVRAVVDTNGSCGLSAGGASRVDGTLERSGGGPNRRLTLTVDGRGRIEFDAVESRNNQIVGSFAEASQKRVWVFVREDDDELFVFNIQTQAAEPPGPPHGAGVEYVCADLLGTTAVGALVADFSSGCDAPAPGDDGAVDTNAAYGLSHHVGPWAFTVVGDILTGSTFRGRRLTPN